MYSRSCSDQPSHLPPHYGGTALHGEGCKSEPCRSEEHEKKREEAKRKDCPPPRREECPEDRPPQPPPERGLLSRLLPFDIKGDDLLLLGIALLLLGDGCEDEYLPLILLFLLIIH